MLRSRLYRRDMLRRAWSPLFVWRRMLRRRLCQWRLLYPGRQRLFEQLGVLWPRLLRRRLL
jgi:hypothetical protein